MLHELHVEHFSEDRDGRLVVSLHRVKQPVHLSRYMLLKFGLKHSRRLSSTLNYFHAILMFKIVHDCILFCLHTGIIFMLTYIIFKVAFYFLWIA